LIYSGSFLVLAIFWNVLWRYAAFQNRLMGGNVSPDQAKNITRQYYAGPVFYAVAFLVAFLSALASVIVIVLVAIFFAVTATISE